VTDGALAGLEITKTRPTGVDPVFFAEAEKLCPSLEYGGHRDWRLPTWAEVKALEEMHLGLVASFGATTTDAFWVASGSQPVAPDATERCNALPDPARTICLGELNDYRTSSFALQIRSDRYLSCLPSELEEASCVASTFCVRGR
jgi:hypothetical protein